MHWSPRSSACPKSRLSSPAQQTLASRIESALEELDKLRLGQITNYASPDLWHSSTHIAYLPEQVNLAHTLSSGTDRTAWGSLAGGALDAVDRFWRRIRRYGSWPHASDCTPPASLNEWPNVVAVYQIDERAMLDVGDQIWRSLALEVSSRNDLSPVASLMSRMLFERTGVPPEPEAVGSSLLGSGG